MSGDNYPISWQQFTSVSDKESELFGKLSKWSARFRLAKSFRAMDLGDVYNEDTVKRYSAITKVFLSYTAFEQYCQTYNIKSNAISELQERYQQQEKIQKIRSLAKNNKFFEFLKKYLKGKNQDKMQTFIEGEETNISFLAMSVRHIFAHGGFAAHSSGLSAKRFEEISQIISDFLLDCMDLDFTDRVNGL